MKKSTRFHSLPPDELYQRLLDDSYRLVSIRPRSKHEIVSRLQARISESQYTTLLRVIERLEELGYVDDTAFTTWWISQRQQAKPRGRMVVRRELLVKGIPKDIIEQVFTKAMWDETQAARRVLEKKVKSLAGYTGMMRKKKAYEFLSRRGFSYETIASVIDENM